MSHFLCPHWVGYLLVSPLRRLFHDPERILRPHVTSGMTVLDVGPAMGFFTLPLAGMVGPAGRVVAVDIQDSLLRSLRKRALRAGVSDRIVARQCRPDSLVLDDFGESFDFCVAFAVVHEVPDAGRLLADIFRSLKPGATCLIAEPRGHVPLGEFKRTLSVAREAGFRVADGPNVNCCHAALLIRDRD